MRRLPFILAALVLFIGWGANEAFARFGEHSAPAFLLFGGFLIAVGLALQKTP